MRKALDLSPQQNGVLVTRVLPSSTCDGILQAGDIITSLDEYPVDRAGMVTIDGAQMNGNEIVERKFVGDPIKIEFLRHGKLETKIAVLKNFTPKKIYSVQYEKQPRYTISAGLVFQPLDSDVFMAHKFEDSEVRRLFADFVQKHLFKDRQEIVVLTQILSDDMTNHLNDFQGLAVESVNNIPVKSLTQLHELLHPKDMPEFFVIKLFNGDRPLILPSQKIAEADKRISERYAIPTLFRLTDTEEF